MNEPYRNVRWTRINDEPVEYAIHEGLHGDEFVKLQDGACLRRPIKNFLEWLRYYVREGMSQDKPRDAESVDAAINKLSNVELLTWFEMWQGNPT